MFNYLSEDCLTGFCRHAALLAGALLLCASFAARGDEIQDAYKLYKQGQHDRALTIVNEFIPAHPQDARARFLLGLIQSEQGNTGEAIGTLTALTEDFPELPEPYNNLAVLHAKQGQYEKARMELEMALRNNPGYATAHENLGDIHARMAGQSYERAGQLDHKNTAVQAKLKMIQELLAAGKEEPDHDAQQPGQ